MADISGLALNILIIDDDEVDRMTVRRALNSQAQAAHLTEAVDASEALAALNQTQAPFNCIILDYRLPGTDGLSLLRRIRRQDTAVPVIMMTGQHDERLIVDIMKAGATDYLSKANLTPENLMVSIRNAIRVQRAEQAIRERTRQAVLGAEVGVILTSTDPIQKKLERCAEAIVGHYEALSIHIWTLTGEAQTLDWQASAGTGSSLDEKDKQIPVGQGVIGLIAQNRQLYVSADAANDPLIDHAWIGESPLRAFAGYPLTAQDKVVGVMAVLSKQPISPPVLEGVSSITDEFALAIQQAQNALEIERLYRQAQEAVELRDVFLSVASHELKTPLTSLMANVQLFIHRATRENSLNERDTRTLGVILEQTGRLNHLIGALLDISRLQNGKLTIQREPMDLAALAKRLVTEVQPTLERHTIALDDYPGALPLLGDEVRLEQVIQNLLQNAIKYSPKGGTITVRMGTQDGTAFVAVTDQGIGIPQNALPNLFDRYFRAPNADQRNIGGMGLGLYIVREIVGLHGGTIEVHSVEGQGSTFTVKLPMQNVVDERITEPSAAEMPRL